MSLDAVREVHALVARVDLTGIRAGLGALVHRLRHAGLGVSDRRAVKLQRLIAASAVLCGRVHAVGSDLWEMRHIWDTPEQQEVLGPVVNRVLETAHAAEQASEEVVAHPRSHDDQKPSPEALAEALQQVEQQLQQSEVSAVDRAYLQDRLGLLTNRCHWVSNDTQREALLEQANRLRELIAAASG